jgi:mannose-6-phosphate isomerase-like protein (cupin superfamily)
MKSGLKIVKKPWGGYEILEKGRDYWIKKIFINKGSRLSLQSHKNRNEIWIVLRGKITAIVQDHSHFLGPGKTLEIQKNQKHRVTGLTNACIIEVALGKPRETDIIRYQDDYGRIK